jgi:hypothetical protein
MGIIAHRRLPKHLQASRIDNRHGVVLLRKHKKGSARLRGGEYTERQCTDKEQGKA